MAVGHKSQIMTESSLFHDTKCATGTRDNRRVGLKLNIEVFFNEKVLGDV